MYVTRKSFVSTQGKFLILQSHQAAPVASAEHHISQTWSDTDSAHDFLKGLKREF